MRGLGERAENEILIAAIFDLTGPTADVGLDYAEGVQGHVHSMCAGYCS